MRHSNFITALTILSNYHTNEIIINKPPANGSVGKITSGEPTIHITSCCGGAITELTNAKFSLSMSKGLLLVEDYSI